VKNNKQTFLLIILLFILITLFSGCKRSSQNDSIVTFLAQRGDYIITIEGQGELEAKESKKVSAPRIRGGRPSISYLILEGSIVKKGDVVVQLEARTIETTYLSALDDVEIARADENKREAELNLEQLLIKAQIKNTEASLAISKLQLEKLAFEAPNRQELRRVEIAIDELELEKNRKKLIALKKIQKEERIHLQMKIVQAQNTMQSSKRSLDQLTLTSPFDGIVVYGVNWSTGDKVQEGDAVFPGMPIVNIPDLSVMQVKMQLGETDAQKITKGDSARIFIPTIEELKISGKVTKVDKIAKPIKRGSKIKKVEVTVELDSTVTKLVPGLTAYCDIVTKKLTNTIAVPLEGLFEHDSLKIVYVKKDQKFIPFPVTINTQSEDFVFINKGLNGDEKCAMREPSDSQINWPDSLKQQVETKLGKSL
jgi:HlyD family secretion protein